MFGLLWALIVILVIAWLLGLTGVLHLVGSIIWIFLVVAVILAILSFVTGGRF